MSDTLLPPHESKVPGEVPIEHLDYAYVRECKSAAEVERILQILRSGQEGGLRRYQARMSLLSHTAFT